MTVTSLAPGNMLAGRADLHHWPKPMRAAAVLFLSVCGMGASGCFPAAACCALSASACCLLSASYYVHKQAFVIIESSIVSCPTIKHLAHAQNAQKPLPLPCPRA